MNESLSDVILHLQRRIENLEDIVRRLEALEAYVSRATTPISTVVANIPRGTSLTVTDSYGTHYLTPEGSLPGSSEPDPVKFREWT